MPILVNLRPPVLHIQCRCAIVLRTSVPPAPVDEYGDAASCEDDVGGSSKARQGPNPDAISEAASVDGAPYRQLRSGIASTVALHRPADRGRGSPRRARDPGIH